VCIESALALRAMLSRRGVASTLHYGIRNDEDAGLKAHVWLSLDGRILIGGETAEQFTEVATFRSFVRLGRGRRRRLAHLRLPATIDRSGVVGTCRR
jgi:hypothetical protein